MNKAINLSSYKPPKQSQHQMLCCWFFLLSFLSLPTTSLAKKQPTIKAKKLTQEQRKKLGIKTNTSQEPKQAVMIEVPYWKPWFDLDLSLGLGLDIYSVENQDFSLQMPIQLHVGFSYMRETLQHSFDFSVGAYVGYQAFFHILESTNLNVPDSHAFFGGYIKFRSSYPAVTAFVGIGGAQFTDGDGSSGGLLPQVVFGVGYSMFFVDLYYRFGSGVTTSILAVNASIRVPFSYLIKNLIRIKHRSYLLK